MTREFIVRMGKRVEPEEVKSLDPALRGRTQATPQENGEVEGQEFWYQQACGCPWCGASNWLWLSDSGEPWFGCWRCGKAFCA